MTYDETTDRTRDSLSPEDRYVLLGLVAFAAIMFGGAWLGSRTFSPSAKLFPYFLAVTGLLISAIAAWRVWRGDEPKSSPDRMIESDDTDPRTEYLRSFRLLGGIVLYFAGIALLGFVAATAVNLVVFPLIWKESIWYAIGSALVSTCFVLALSWGLGLYLPNGLIFEALRL